MPKYLITSILFFFAIILVRGQQIINHGILPFVQNYTVEDYKAARQNFDVTQDGLGLMYFANSDEAVLVFDGSQWQRITVPNNSVFSVEADSNTVYVGARNDFGYLKHTADYGLVYQSLLDKVPSRYRSFGNVWQITISPDSQVIYFSPYIIFFYDRDTIRLIHIDSIDVKSLFLRMFNVRNHIYFTLKYRGIYRLVDDTLQYIAGTDTLWDLMAMLPYKNKSVLLYSFYKGFFVYDGKQFKHLQTDLDGFLKQNIYRAIDIKNRYYVFALISGGVLITDHNLVPVQFLNVNTGLYNDKVQNLYLDNQNNLWLALDNGIATVQLFTPFTVFDKNYGFSKSTKIFSALPFDRYLFVANSDGLFWRPWPEYENKIQPFVKFKLVEGVSQKTFTLRTIDDKVFGVNDLGLYYVQDFRAYYLSKIRGLINFIRLKSAPNVIIGVKDALQLFEKTGGKWVSRGIIKNFKEPLRYIAEDPHGFIWGSEKTAGVYRIYLNDSHDSVVKVVHYNSQAGLHGLKSQFKNFVFPVKNNVIFATVNGLYRYNYRSDSFVPIEKLNRLLGQNREVNLIYQDSAGNYWIRRLVKQKDNKYWELDLLKRVDTGYVLIDRPFYPFRNKIFSISQISRHQYIIGSEGRFILYDDRVKFDFTAKFPTYLRMVKLLANDSVLFRGFARQSNVKNDVPILPYKFNDLRFVFSAGYYSNPKNVEYSYYLEGYDESWSPWVKENIKEYSNLPAGNYTFYVRSKNIYDQYGTTASFSFIIRPPWYLTIWAFFLYIILAALLVWLIVYLYTLRLRRQKEYLEEQVRLRTIEIEKQKQEIEAQRDLLAKQNEEIKRKNKDITASIEYAKRIQTAMLPLEETISKYLPEHFIFFKPRDIVSGDFYWFAYKNGKIIIAAVDCTGHGVPGAFMSMIGAEILNTIVLTNGITDPAKILNLLNVYIRTALKQDTTDNQDGMDVALCVIDRQAEVVEFAGAKNPLIYIDKNHQLHKIRGDRQSIGGYQYTKIVSFTKHVIPIDPPMWFYIFSDGYQDQFGGPGRPSKFLTTNFYALLHRIHQLPMKEQKRILEETFEQWKNGHSQTDDILVIGFKL